MESRRKHLRYIIFLILLSFGVNCENVILYLPGWTLGNTYPDGAVIWDPQWTRPAGLAKNIVWGQSIRPCCDSCDLTKDIASIIALIPSDQSMGTYSIWIGTNCNNVTEVRKNNIVIGSFSTPKINDAKCIDGCSPSYYFAHQDYWIGWDDDILSFGKGSEPGEDKVFQIQLDNSVDVIGHRLSASGTYYDLIDIPSKYVGEITYSHRDGYKHPSCSASQALPLVAVPVDSSTVSKVFEVQSCENLFVQLRGSSKIGIYIGGDGNRKTQLVIDGIVYMQVDTPGILWCSVEWQPFWVSWEQNIIKVGQGMTVGTNTILQYFSTNTIMVDSMRLGYCGKRQSAYRISGTDVN